MQVCANIKLDGSYCGREMVCQKTGMDVLVEEYYSYRGDLYKCPDCGTMVVKANDTGIHSSTPVVVNNWTVRLKQ